MSWLKAAVLLAALTPAALAQTPTTITVTSRVLHANVKRFGINLSGQTFYDSGQMSRNLIARNPGFEGGTWQTILRCKHFGSSTCADENPYTVWPDGFLNGAHLQVLSGPAAGAQTLVTDSHAAAAPLGYSLNFNALDREPHDNDFILVRVDKPGEPTAGWWPNLSCGATATAERTDLPPHATGKQTLRVNADAPCQRAELASYFDSFEGHSFVKLHGQYTLSFRAKATGGANSIHLVLQRLDTKQGIANFLDKTVPLTTQWYDYSIPLRADDRANALGSVRLQLILEGTSALLDDVSLTAVRTPRNSTAFRDEVVAALREAHPGILRFMDNGSNFGASLEDLIASPFARQRTGYSTQKKLRDDVALGLPEILELSAAVDAEPWISLPAGFNPWEMQGLIEYLSGPATSKYGARRAAAGHPKPWTEVFPVIHLELGNEQWNSLSFSGAALHDPIAYGQRAAAVFNAARKSPGFNPARFDLVAGSWFGVPWWSENEAKALNGAADTLAVAPYIFSEFNDSSTGEAIFGPMFAQPEQLSTGNGTMVQQRNTVAKAGKRLSIYEVNLGTATGNASVTQFALDHTVPSLGGGLAVADHMLLMLRELGITDQCFFALPEYQNGFTSTNGGPKRTTPLWGGVVDMGGSTDLRRPTFLALAAINHAVLANMVATDITGNNPTWTQPASTNDKVTASNPHLLQVFAFAEGNKHSLIIFNLSRTQPLPIALNGVRPTRNTVTTTVLTADHIDDNNEAGEHVKPHTTTDQNFRPESPRTLPPFSMTTYTWTE